jgi:hypothetical protein
MNVHDTAVLTSLIKFQEGLAKYMLYVHSAVLFPDSQMNERTWLVAIDRCINAKWVAKERDLYVLTKAGKEALMAQMKPLEVLVNEFRFAVISEY